MKKIVALILIAILIFSFSACGEKVNNIKEESNKNESKKIIAVSVLPQKNFVEAVCSEDYEVITMIPPGASPETYEPTPAEMQKLEQADIYFSIGIRAEETSILPSIKENTKIVPLHEHIAQSYEELKLNGERDPHIWLSPKRMMAMVSIISEILQKENSNNAEKYNENALNYIKKLSILDSEVTAMFSEKSGKDFMVFHPSFGYLAADYGLNMHALEQDGKEATAKRLAELTDFAKDKNIKTVFYQAENSGKQATAFAEEIGGKAVVLNPLAEDYIENFKKMAEDISSALS